MAESHAYPKITEAQLEIWLNNGVTRTYLQCLGWKRDDYREANGEGKLVDSSNADMTHAMAHLMMGRMDAMTVAAGVEKLMNDFEMIEYPPPEETEEEDPDDDD